MGSRDQGPDLTAGILPLPCHPAQELKAHLAGRGLRLPDTSPDTIAQT